MTEHHLIQELRAAVEATIEARGAAVPGGPEYSGRRLGKFVASLDRLNTAIAKIAEELGREIERLRPQLAGPELVALREFAKRRRTFFAHETDNLVAGVGRKEIRNALGYMVRKNEITRLAYGRYCTTDASQEEQEQFMRVAYRSPKVTVKKTRQDRCRRGHSLTDAFIDKRGTLNCRSCARLTLQKRRAPRNRRKVSDG
jgi:hypothetical protein